MPQQWRINDILHPLHGHGGSKPSPTPDSSTFNNRFSERWEDSDITILVENEEFHCHSSIFKFISPVLYAMFKGNFREARERHVALPGKDKESFNLFLNLVYPMTRKYEPVLNRSVLKTVLQYADEYQVESVPLQIDSLFAYKIAPFYGRRFGYNVGECIEDLRTAEVYGLKDTRKQCIKYLISVDNANSFGYTLYKLLTTETKYEILVGKLQKAMTSMDQGCEKRAVARIERSSSRSGSPSQTSQSTSFINENQKRGGLNAWKLLALLTSDTHN